MKNSPRSNAEKSVEIYENRGGSNKSTSGKDRVVEKTRDSLSKNLNK